MVTVYKSDLTGHWIVDRSGTKEHPGSSQQREGFRRHVDALVEAARIADELRARYPAFEAAAR